MQGESQKVNTQRANGNIDLARRMRDALRRAKLTQTEAAAQMGERVTTMSRWLRLDGKGRRPGNGRLKHFAQIVGVSVEALEGREPFPAEPERGPYDRAVDMVDALAEGSDPITAAARAAVSGDKVTPEFMAAADELLLAAQESLFAAWSAMTREEKLVLLGDLVVKARRSRSTAPEK